MARASIVSAGRKTVTYGKPGDKPETTPESEVEIYSTKEGSSEDADGMWQNIN